MIFMEERAIIIRGVAKSPLWRQIVPDVLGITLFRTENSDSSFGSAMLAGVATGVFDSFDNAIEKFTKKISETRPTPENTKLYRKQFEIYKEIHDALAPVYQKMKL